MAMSYDQAYQYLTNIDTNLYDRELSDAIEAGIQALGDCREIGLTGDEPDPMTNDLPSPQQLESALGTFQSIRKALSDYTAYVHSHADYRAALDAAIGALQECLVYRKAVAALEKAR